MNFKCWSLSLFLTFAFAHAGQDKKEEAKSARQGVAGALVVKGSDSYFPGSCGYRKAIGGLVKVYQICFFGKNAKANEWNSVFDSDSKSFKFKLSFLRGVGGKKVSSAFSEGFSKIPAENKLEESERQKFIKWSSELKIDKDSVLEITFNESAPLHVEFHQKANERADGVLFESKQKSVAKSLAAIWLGSKPVSEELKIDLLKEANE
jgi:hypothetical protein